MLELLRHPVPLADQLDALLPLECAKGHCWIIKPLPCDPIQQSQYISHMHTQYTYIHTYTHTLTHTLIHIHTRKHTASYHPIDSISVENPA